MTDSFQQLKELVQDNRLADPSQFAEACQQRLLTALGAVESHYAPGKGDIASLVRHVLRREDEQQRGQSQLLKVPRLPSWPDRETWQQSGMDILDEKPTFYLISARAWQPDWLPDAASSPPDGPAFREAVRRNYEPVSGDPFLSLVNLDQYRSAGQREAIRAVLTAPEGATLAINLPTGAGKSLCAQLPALLRSKTSGVSVVVVPTTALAMDQERALKPFVDHPTAYYGDESAEGKERRKAIRDRLHQGTQRIIFTSPESLLDSLAPSLYEAAKLGMLRYFVIDEAHMVEQWGNEFRPAFQELPGLRRDLLRQETPFTTLLLTATLTESCLDTLETLFGQPGPFQVLSAVQLRPEPSYWFAWCQSEEVRQQRLLEAVHHLPRPLIIYGTKVADVEQWQRELARAGFKRCAIMTGKSSPEKRSQLIQNWREKKVDIVVATSAFGLGVDQADVRAVIHVCAPETIDRFYQEVGRGGRDGKAAVSLTLHTTEDLEVAKSLNEESTITIKRGLERWQSMFDGKERTLSQKFRVPVNVPPSRRQEDIDMDGQQNRAWNIRTLTLMSRAGLIAIDSERPPQKKNFESEEAYSQAIQSHRDFRLIDIRNEYHSDIKIWEAQIEPIRQQRQSYSYKNLQLMKEALRAKRCISEILAEAYTIPAREIPPRGKVAVSRACGGCPFCRKNGVEPFPGTMPTPRSVWHPLHFFVGTELQRLLAGEKLLLIFYDSIEQRGWERRRNQLFRWLIAQGIRNVVSPPEFNGVFTQEADRVPDAYIFFFANYQPFLMPKIPTLIFHPQRKTVSHICLSQFSTSQAPRIILLPVGTPDPEKDYRSLIDVFSGRSFRFESFCTEIGL